MSPEMCRI